MSSPRRSRSKELSILDLQGAAGQTVWHYHHHQIPRHRGDAMSFHGRGKGDETRLRAIAAKLAARVEPAAAGAR